MSEDMHTRTPTSAEPGAGSHGALPRISDRAFWILVALCVASVAADLFYHKHGYYGFQEWIGFDAGVGLIAGVCVVLAAKGLRVLLSRDEGYYD